MKKDIQTVDSDGKRIIHNQIEGVKTQESLVQFDERGSTCEIHNMLWNFSEQSLGHVYFVTIRPKIVKGWVKHHLQEDRIMLIKGESRLVLYDDRENSPTYQSINVHWLSDKRPTLISIPTHVYHAFQNIGEEDMYFVNMPTLPYCYENPDKYRLPLKNDKIQFDWDGAKGW